MVGVTFDIEGKRFLDDEIFLFSSNSMNACLEDLAVDLTDEFTISIDWNVSYPRFEYLVLDR